MEKESKIIDTVDPVSIEGTKKILNQLINCICKIKAKKGFGTGFFCEIPFKKEKVKVFITNYTILSEKDLKENKKLKLLLNDENKIIILDLEIKRKTYINKDYDITIIELKEEDKIKDYLELDDNLFQDNSDIIYEDKSIYILHYPNGKNACVSYGLLNNIDNYNIIFKCFADNGSFGAPILNLNNNKIIGINKKGSNNYNIGTLLKLPLQDFINKKIAKDEKKSIIIKDINYKVIKELGKGGFGRVIQVLSESDNKYYALKEIIIKEETEEKIKNYQNEAVILSKFNCDKIVKYYDSYIDQRYIYILMEFCDGKNLRNFLDKYINNNTLIEEKIIKNIINQICLGLKEIHDKKVIHRDLKPENIFMNENMDIKIGDFGISKQLNILNTHTLTKNKSGTDYYIAPEILIKGIYNEKSDIWSLGCIIYELFNLDIYYKDRIMYDIKKINPEIYNNKWQELIISLLEPDYTKRFDINQTIKFIENIGNENENIKINNKTENKSLIKNNIIIGEIYIEKEDINKDIEYLNEKEIKENIEIKINGEIIEFTYYYKFNKEGKYIIEYSFKNNLTKTCYMFYDCNSLTNLDLSNFNSETVNNKNHMFDGCNSLLCLNKSKLVDYKNKNNEHMLGELSDILNYYFENYLLLDYDIKESNYELNKKYNISKFVFEKITLYPKKYKDILVSLNFSDEKDTFEKINDIYDYYIKNN